MKKFTLAASLGLSVLSSQTAFSAPNSAHMETTLVTATRTEQFLAESLAPVTIFERADIERIQPNDLQELLSRAAGVAFVRNGGRGAATSLFLRGNQSNHTLVMVDGVRIGSATLGSPSLTNLPPELIERIEIVRGSRSSLYGSEAIGGVINIITKKYHDTDGLRPLFKLSVGENNSEKAVLALTGGNAQTQGSLSIFHESTDGVDSTASKTHPHGDDDGFEQTAYNLSLSHQVNDMLSLSGLYQLSESESDYDGDCYGSGFVRFDCAPYSEGLVQVANIRADIKPMENWLLSLSAGESVDDSQIAYRFIDPAASGVVPDNFKTKRRIVNVQNDWFINPQHIVTLGYEELDDEVDSSQAYAQDNRKNTAGFAQWQGDFNKLDVVVGGRYDDNEQFGHHTTGNASAGYALSEALKFIISYGEGFNAPTFNDLYYPFYGVATLEPETSTNKEISLQATRSWGEWRISHFRNDVDKLIQYNPATYGPDQIDAAKMNGVEVSVSTTVNNWHIDSNLTRLQARDKNTGKDLPRRPDTQFNIDIGRQWQKWGAGASLRVVSRRFDDPANNDALAGYGLLDSSLSYQFNKVVKLQLAVKNLLDKHYVSARSFSLGNYQSTGREAQLSITITP